MLKHLFAPTLLILFSVFMTSPVFAATAVEIDIKVDDALARFKQEVPGGERFLTRARGVLVRRCTQLFS